MSFHDEAELKRIKEIVRNDKLFHCSTGGSRNNERPRFSESQSWMQEKLKEYQEFLLFLTKQDAHLHEICGRMASSSDWRSFSYHSDLMERSKEASKDMQLHAAMLRESIQTLHFQLDQLKRYPQLKFSSTQAGNLYTEQQRRSLMVLMDDSKYSYADLTAEEIEWIRVAVREIFHNQLEVGFRFFSKIAEQFRKRHPSLPYRSNEEWWICAGKNQLGKPKSSEETLKQLYDIAFNPRKRAESRMIKLVKQRVQTFQKWKTTITPAIGQLLLRNLISTQHVQMESKEPVLLLRYDCFADIKKHVRMVTSPKAGDFYEPPLAVFWDPKDLMCLSWTRGFQKQLQNVRPPHCLLILTESPLEDNAQLKKGVFHHALVIIP